MRVLTKQNIQILAGACIVLFLAAAALGYGVITLHKTQRDTAQDTKNQFDNLSLQIDALITETEVLRATLQGMGESDALRDAEAKKLAEDLGTLSSNVTTLSEDTDISAIVATWSPYVYVLECQFEGPDGVDKTSSGSATLVREGIGINVMTNKHVVREGEENEIEAEECLLKRFDTDTEYEIRGDAIVLQEEKDIAEAPVPEAIFGVLPSKMCTTKASIGDQVLILGYPGIGSKESITATEGIISGFDGDHYITSAKIERGNSGGAAIDVKNDCFLGIPTLVYTGRVESLARILSI